MNTVQKDLLLQDLTLRTEKNLNEAIRHFQNLPHAVLLKNPASGGWSPGQCLEHLNRYGVYYLPEISKALVRAKRFPNRTDFRSSWLGQYFTRMMQPQTGTKKIKAFREYIPPRELDVAAVVAEFIQQQELLLISLREAASVDLASVKIPISISRLIRLKLGDVMQFVIAHTDRHLTQITNALNEK